MRRRELGSATHIEHPRGRRWRRPSHAGCRRHTSWGKLQAAVYSATATRSMVKGRSEPFGAHPCGEATSDDAADNRREGEHADE
jgi:hypothetical protein